ncbi:KilA-N domain-containing protein [Vibrio albus]|uniref:KilA-N domain-containing protein n=1 Tax=Vibrio albus TaxID=2200953 RepID=UPI0015E83FC2|nr:KilA-N domain-containing protein [Vibrio albus]
MNALTILNQSVRTCNNLFSLNDLHKASGANQSQKPANFIRLESTQELVGEINRCSDLSNALEVNRGGNKQGTWVCKELVYAYAMWISAKFHLQVIRAFDSLVSQPLTLTSEQKLKIRKTVGTKAKNDGESHKQVYMAIYNHFSVSEYGDLLQSQFEEAIDFINSLDIRPALPSSDHVPFYSTRLMLTIENGQVVHQNQVPNDAFVVTKNRICTLLSEPGLFSIDEIAKIAQVAQSRMIDMATGLPRLN